MTYTECMDGDEVRPQSPVDGALVPGTSGEGSSSGTKRSSGETGMHLIIYIFSIFMSLFPSFPLAIH